MFRKDNRKIYYLFPGPALLAGCQVPHLMRLQRRLWQVGNSLTIFTHVLFTLISQRELELFSRKLMMRLDIMEVGQHFERKALIQELPETFGVLFVSDEPSFAHQGRA